MADRTGRRVRTATKPAAIVNPYSLSPGREDADCNIGDGSSSDLWPRTWSAVLTRYTFRAGISRNRFGLPMEAS